MTPSEIITQDSIAHGMDPKQILAGFAQLIEKGQLQILHSTRSVLVLRDLGDQTAEAFLFTVDSPIALARSFNKFNKTIIKMGIQKIYIKNTNEGIMRLLQTLGQNVQQSDKPEFQLMVLE